LVAEGRSPLNGWFLVDDKEGYLGRQLQSMFQHNYNKEKQI